jgi:hypothetical protein
MMQRIQWSKLRTRLESLFAPSIAARVSVKTTWYRTTGRGAGRAWITLDDKEVGDFSDARWWRKYYEIAFQLQEANKATSYHDEGKRSAHFEAYESSRAVLDRAGVFSRDAFHDAVRHYPNLKLEDAWQSGFALYRAFVVLDRRMGKRRLKELETAAEEHPVVRTLLWARRDVEGLGKS